MACIYCKGNHDKNTCPWVERARTLMRNNEPLKQDFQGSTPTIFVGHYGYPNLNVGLLSPQHINEDTWKFDAPHHWAKNNYTIPQVADLRFSLVNSRFNTHIKHSHKYLPTAQEIAMATIPAEVEFTLAQRPTFHPHIDDTAAPMGPNAGLNNARITSNTQIHTKIDKVVSDTDLLAGEGITYLYANGFDENTIMRLLSIGTLGKKDNRKLIPTKWSITATDDQLGKQLIHDIKTCPPLNDYLLYKGNYMGNHYLLLFLPGSWQYELYETSTINYGTTTDHEGFEGRKDYTHETAGGYYTARLAILEKLKELKRQASVLALRYITPDYTMPLGVWVTREASRNATQSQPLKFSTKEALLAYVQAYTQKHYMHNSTVHFAASKLLKNLVTQKRIYDF